MKGLHERRIKQNPLEKHFSDKWKKINDEEYCLEYILSEDNTRADIDERDKLVAATVIQWLGSPVGRSFLSEVLDVEI